MSWKSSVSLHQEKRFALNFITPSVFDLLLCKRKNLDKILPPEEKISGKFPDNDKKK
jgi:hypothetical protein